MKKLEKVIVFENELEARHMEAILKEHEIPHIIKSYHDLVYDGLFQLQKGWGFLEAPEEYFEEIEAICDDLTEMENNQQEDENQQNNEQEQQDDEE